MGGSATSFGRMNSFCRIRPCTSPLAWTKHGKQRLYDPIQNLPLVLAEHSHIAIVERRPSFWFSAWARVPGDLYSKWTSAPNSFEHACSVTTGRGNDLRQ